METVGPYGGLGGDPWDDGVNNNIKQIKVIYGDVVHSIITEYEKKDGTSFWSEQHGNVTDGNESVVNPDYPNEYITSVTGYFKDYTKGAFNGFIVSSIKFQTNKTFWGPFGKEEGSPFTISSTSSGKIVGFHGQSSAYIDSIGAHVAPFKDSSAPDEIPSSDSSDVVPTTKYNTVGPFGGYGGESWDDGVNTGIKQIKIFGGDIIDSFQVEYDKNGTSVWSAKHGQSTGGTESVIKLDYPNEYVISISGHHKTLSPGGFILSSLKIRTNKSTYGPYGKEKDHPFSISGGTIVGLYGKSGTYNDSLGAYVVPTINYDTIGPFGGYGGESWDDGVNTGIKQIKIFGGDIIDSFQVEYDRNGTSVWSAKHGQSSGGTESLIKLDYPNEYVISISGHHRTLSPGGFILSSLKITTNKRTYGPYGKEKDHPFSISGGTIVGLYGKSGSYNDSLGAYVIPAIKYNTIGPIGGYGGEEWDDGVNTGIKQIKIFAGDRIDSFQVEYDKNGTSIWSAKHGKSTGGTENLIKLDYPSEYVISIAGSHKTFSPGGYLMTSLKITTNKRAFEPYGKVTENSFLLSGEKILGLFGKSGTYNDSLGAYVAPPAEST